MKTPSRSFKFIITTALACCATIAALAQVPDNPRPREGGPGQGGPGFAGPGGPGGFPGGRGGFGPGQERPLVSQFDKDGDKRLNAEERKAALEFLRTQPQGGRGGRRGFGPGGRGGESQPPQPGPKVAQADVKKYGNEPLYDPKTLRTFFLEFESSDWEKELIAFNNTDVDVPAKLTVDGKTYQDVGIHVRGMSSSFVGEGQKHSLNLEIDWVHEKQNLGGYRTLNLLNSHEDPSLLRSVLYLQVAREYIPAPKANFVRVVINGESWGIYPNVQQFNKELIQDFFGTTKGARWKAPGSPGGRATLAYLGEDAAQYKNFYSIKTKDDKKSWASLIKLTKVLNQTPPDQLEKALEPILDIDGALKFLALENVLVNNDGYWIRTSDYSLYLDEKGRFHILPHDANETFARPGGPGFGGRGGRGGRGGPGGPGFDGGPEGRGFRGRGPEGEFGPGRGDVVQPAPGRGVEGGREGRGFAGGPEGFGPDGPGGRGGRGGFGGGPQVEGVKLDPLLDEKDSGKPLISKLLAVPALRARYLGYVKDIAEKWLDWNKLGPIAEEYHALIAEDVRKDTRKLESTESFDRSIGSDVQGEGGGPFGGRGTIGLKNFADQRRAYLLDHPEIKKPGK